ncbi:S41 family peptidase [uncultured Treponema sp.]|uniref:S41 family peptidase n=1 Tax=uncultured Treponema sp. TaxID=162155 RepID=UPI002611A9C6|nr:S41 family peptidase [uncultured Treponema sp.]
MKKSVIMVSLLAFLALFAFSFAGCADGADGLNGKDGANGVGFVWKGELESAPSNPEYMWAYYNKTDGCSYVWNGSSWDLLNGSSYASYDIETLDLTKKDLYFREVSGETVVNSDEMKTYYFKDDIIYTFIDADFLEALKTVYECDFTMTEVNKDTTKVVITNTTRNATATFDLAHRSLSFSNYDAFFQSSDVYSDMTGTFPYLERTSASNIAGQEIELSWASQNIHVGLYKDGDTYKLSLPNQFCDDILGCAYQNLYNGNYLYSSSELSQSILLKDYYEQCSTPGKRSQTLADFTYNELCLNLDFNYGLKAIHGIESFPDFDTYFIAQGMKNDLKSTDAVTFTKALIDVVNFYFGDGHSGFISNSCWAGKDTITGNKTSNLEKKYYDTRDRYGAARAKAISDSASYNEESGESVYIPAYTVSSDGKTVIVRFDAFTCCNYKYTLKKDAPEGELSLEAARDALLANNNELLNNYVDRTSEEKSQYDTISVIAAAHELIKQRDSDTSTPTVENIVLDLSRNGGGRFTAAAYVIAWMLGECTMDFTNPITGAKFSATYSIDADLDGSCGGEKDSVKGKNLFCLISPMSFSCGNLTPAVLKESDRVTILGVTSGGGASSVHHTSCADGSSFQISSKYVMSTSKNGSNYDMDQGVSPHYYINKPENFYTTDNLAALVNSINSGKAALSSN